MNRTVVQQDNEHCGCFYEWRYRPVSDTQANRGLCGPLTDRRKRAAPGHRGGDCECKNPGQRAAHPASVAWVGHCCQGFQQSFVGRRVRIGRRRKEGLRADVTSGSDGWPPAYIQARWSHPPQRTRRSHDDKSQGHSAVYQPFWDRQEGK